MNDVAGLKSAVQDVADDEARLAALNAYDILDTPNEPAFARIARLVKAFLGVETAIVSLMDSHRQWYKAAEGTGVREVPLNEALCRVLLEGAPLLVGDATRDTRFAANPHVTAENGVRFYVGVPLKTPQGHVIGSICAIDPRPREEAGNEIAILQEFAQLVMDELELRQLVSEDGLTGAMSRRAFKEAAARDVSLAKRHRTALSALVLDIDHFKSINAAYGHPGGDQVLAAVARAIQEELRSSDLFGRLGGGEFAVLLPHAPAERAYDVAEKLRQIVRALRIPGSQPPISVSASIGVAALDPGSDDIESLLGKADQALHDAKRSGRNRTSVWRPSGSQPQQDRRRVLKAGRLIFNKRFSAVDCTVRALWATGAEVSVAGTLGLPDEVTLAIASEQGEWRCHVNTRTDTRLVLDFV